MRLFLQNDPVLPSIVTDIDVAKFEAGSLIVSYNLTFAAEDKSEADLVEFLENDLHTALSDESIIQKATLNIQEAALVSMNGGKIFYI